MKRFDIDSVFFFVALAMALVIGVFFGCEASKRSLHHEAIQHGVGRYVVDENRNVTFEWIERKP